MKTLERLINDQSLGTIGDDALPDSKTARQAYADARRDRGFSHRPGSWLSEPKTVGKFREGTGRAIYGMALAPFTAAGPNACPWEDDCEGGCVAGAGNGSFASVQGARAARADVWATDAPAALRLLVDQLDRAGRREGGLNKVACRLNTFSDVRWERVLPVWFWDRYAAVEFYDYTKAPLRARPQASLPANYRLTYSVSPRSTPGQITAQRAAGRSVAVVIGIRGGVDRRTGVKRPLPDIAAGIDGDVNDRRYADPAGAIVMLRRKGTLRANAALVRDPATIAGA